MSKQVWMPLEVGTFSTDEATLAVAGNELSIITDEGDNTRIVGWTFPGNVRVCQLTDDAEPVSASVPVDQRQLEWIQQALDAAYGNRANLSRETQGDMVRLATWLDGAMKSVKGQQEILDNLKGTTHASTL